MSEISIFGWTLFEEPRRREYLDRVKSTTSRYHAKYSELLSDLENQGFSEFLPSEFAQMRSQLSDLEYLLGKDPEKARNISMQIGAQISRLPAMARSAKREFETKERLRRQEISDMRRQASSELEQFLQSKMTEISDPIELDFAFDKLRDLQKEFAGRVVDSQELQKIKDVIHRQVISIRAEASSLAQEWKNRKEQETSPEAQQTLFNLHKQQATADIALKPDAIKSVVDSLDSLQKQLNGQVCTLDELQEKLSSESEKIDAGVVDENCRRMVVRAIMDSLEKTGFQVDTPKREVGAKDEVVILARKPAGASANFRITADGNMEYKFDHYDGMKCKSDIDQILPMLQDIYGIKLSDERVLWQNPDRISAETRPTSTGGHHHGER